MKKKYAWPVLLLAVFALSRWPKLMPQNFSVTYAILFCGGLYVAGIWYWLIPLCLVDIFITLHFYMGPDFSVGEFLGVLATNYLAYAGIIGLGRWFGAKRPWWVLTCGGLLGALVFYVVTNTASWLQLGYAKTLAGWLQALTVGLPGYPPTWTFFRNTFLSSGLFTALFVGAVKMAEEKSPVAAEEEDEEKTSATPAGEPAKSGS